MIGAASETSHYGMQKSVVSKKMIYPDSDKVGNVTDKPEALGTAAPQRRLKTTSFQPPLVIRVFEQEEPQINQLSSRAPREIAGESKTSGTRGLKVTLSIVRLLLIVASVHSNHRKFWLTIFLASTCLCDETADRDNSLTVFDTSGSFSNSSVNLKIISLLNVGGCSAEEVQSNYKTPTNIPVQVVRLGLSTPVSVTQCMISYSAKLYHCESNVFRSDIYPPVTLEKNRILELDMSTCHKIGSTHSHTFELYGKPILIPELTSSMQHMTVNLIGVQKSNGGCEGKRIDVGGVIYESGVITVDLKAYVRDLVGLYSMEENTIRIQNMIRFSSTQHRCDSELGCFSFQPDDLPRTRCEKTTELFVGQARFHDVYDSHYTPIITVTSNNQVSQGISLTLTSRIILCKREVWATNVDGIFINKVSSNDSSHEFISHRLFEVSKDFMSFQEEAKMLDILGSLSSAVTEVALLSANQFNKIAKELCLLRRTDLQLMLSDLANLPAPALLNYRRGLLFKRAASVIYVYVGIPKTAKLRHTAICYEEIPISFQDSFGNIIEAFATSKGRIIVLNGTRISCSSGRPMHFLPMLEEEEGLISRDPNLLDEIWTRLLNPSNVRGIWLCQDPTGFHTCSTPTVLKPTLSESFQGMPKHFMSQSLFGREGRKKLYIGQTESHDRQVMVTNWKAIYAGVIQATPKDLFLGSLSTQAADQLRRAVFPVVAALTDAVGMFEYVEIFIITMYVLNVICGLIFLVARLHLMLMKYGLSVKLFLAIFHQLYQVIIPWVKIKDEMRENHEMLRKDISELRAEGARGIAEVREQASKDLFELRDELVQLNRRIDVFLVSAIQHPPNFPGGIGPM